MIEPVKIGVVGVGYLGSIHARIYARLPGAALIGVNDVDSDAGKQVSAECGCSFYSNVDQLADSIDAVSVVVPTTCHREVSLFLVKRNTRIVGEAGRAHPG
jgi:predicted dehydrogenase